MEIENAKLKLQSEEYINKEKLMKENKK